MAATTKTSKPEDAQPLEPVAEIHAPVAEEKPHDPNHGRWILDPITGEKRNNNEG
ncbi:hypothetical protein [Methylomonas sp. ZR1]|uniref:hypothetical protein n=1 Tax=Methylomonas sp. ZR1 TaxID=1797072 RepID=UPI001492E881|nr:hypothetical protein [Methylomonas sp. ZR1]